MIYYYCPISNEAIGGIKQIYRHVSALTSRGIEASVLYGPGGTRCTWFKNDTPLAWLQNARVTDYTRYGISFVSRRSRHLQLLRAGQPVVLEKSGVQTRTQLNTDDVIVIPEFYGTHLSDVARDFRTVVFNQRALGTFLDWGFDRRQECSIYHRSTTIGVLCVSNFDKQYLQYVFPHTRVLRTINGVSSRFASSAGKRVRRICFMPRKLRPHIEQALQTLHARGVLAGWELDPLDGLTEAQVATRMQSASVFMSTSSDEGFGLPALEAAAAGCLLVGYDGHGGREIFHPNYTWRVAQNDAHALAVALEEVLVWVDANPELADQRRAALSRELSVTYSEEAERRSVIEAWQTLCPDCIENAKG